MKYAVYWCHACGDPQCADSWPIDTAESLDAAKAAAERDHGQAPLEWVLSAAGDEWEAEVGRYDYYRIYSHEERK
ncbi:hypothetical protein [Nocardia niwae]|uniref:hypothetical protein n=1 Tax=Nocardia niwae TaxID=626084 RepID=UPI0007A46F10|nr:hypothetical protein [Nocardia niwae]